MDVAKIGVAEQRSLTYSLADMFAMVTAACFLAGASTIPDKLFDFGNGALVRVYAVLLVICGVRIWLYAKNTTPRNRGWLFFITIFLLLPYVYSSTSLLSVPLQLPIHKWIGDPIWIFFIPTCSFAISNNSKKINEPNVILSILLSLFELVILFPLWTYFWVVLQLVIADSFVL